MGIHRMRTQGTKRARRDSQGFTLVAALLMLLLLSGIAIGLLMMVNTEGKVGGTDLQNNLAYHAAEGGIEKMSSDLAAVFQNAESPTAADICSAGGPATGGLASNEPAMVGVTWTDYQVTPGQVGYPCPLNSAQTSLGTDQWRAGSQFVCAGHPGELASHGGHAGRAAG